MNTTAKIALKIISASKKTQPVFLCVDDTMVSKFGTKFESVSKQFDHAVLQKLLKIIKKYNSDGCLDYATVQESIGTIYLLTANLPQAKTHFKKALKIYEKVWADDPEMIESKYQEIQELYPQMGIALAKGILSPKLK